MSQLQPESSASRESMLESLPAFLLPVHITQPTILGNAPTSTRRDGLIRTSMTLLGQQPPRLMLMEPVHGEPLRVSAAMPNGSGPRNSHMGPIRTKQSTAERSQVT